MVPVHVRISAAGVFRGECREALRTLVWFKVRGAWTRFAVDLLVFETGQPVIIGYISLVAWGWVDVDGPVARYKTPSALRSQLTGWMHGFHAAVTLNPNLSLSALSALLWSPRRRFRRRSLRPLCWRAGQSRCGRGAGRVVLDRRPGNLVLLYLGGLSPLK